MGKHSQTGAVKMESTTVVATEPTTVVATEPVKESLTQTSLSGTKPESLGTQVGVKTDLAKSVLPEAKWYEKDERWDKVWKKNPENIINGYKTLDEILETKYKPTFKMWEDLQGKFKGVGIDSGKIDDYINEYKSLKDPNNAVNQVYNLLKELISDDDLAAQDFDLAIEKIKEGKLSRKYPGVDAELREKLIAQEKETHELKQWKESLEQQENDKLSFDNVTKSLDSIKKIAESKGFEFNDSIKAEFLKHCQEKNVPTAYIVQEFRNKYDEALDKSYENKLKSSMLEEQQSKNKTTIQVTKLQKNDLSKKKSFEERLGELLNPKK